MIASNLIEPLARLARERGFEPAAILAVVDVESGGRIFTRIEGRDEPLIRFEGHYFDRRLSGARRARARALGLAHPHAGMVANPASQAARYRLLSRAEAIDRDAARESCSWGAGQVMGANWSWLGYGSVDALVDEARAGAEGQVRLMLAFIVKAGLADALAQRDWHAFARRYNGPAYASNGYHTRLARAFEHANDAVHKADDRDDVFSMGTTLVGVWFREGDVLVANVGDSRAYRWRAGELVQLTRDHSLVSDYLDAGLLTPAQVPDFPFRNIINRGIGLRPAVEVDRWRLPTEADDRILLCSDGLTDLVDDKTIAGQLAGEDFQPQAAADALVALANEAGGVDNITAVVVHVLAEES